MQALLLFSVWTPALAEGSPVTVSVKVDSVDLSATNSGTVSLRVDQVPSPGLAGYKATLTFDPRRLEVEGIVKTGDFAAPVAEIDNRAGRLVLVAAQAVG